MKSFNPRAVCLIVLACVLAVVYVVGWTDWFRTREMPILVRQMVADRVTPIMKTVPVTFALDQPYELTRVRVIRVTPMSEDSDTGATLGPVDRGDDADVVWELVGRSEPTTSFRFGQHVPGMSTSRDIRLTPLEPGVEYRIELTARGGRGEVVFTSRALRDTPQG